MRKEKTFLTKTDGVFLHVLRVVSETNSSKEILHVVGGIRIDIAVVNDDILLQDGDIRDSLQADVVVLNVS